MGSKAGSGRSPGEIVGRAVSVIARIGLAMGAVLLVPSLVVVAGVTGIRHSGKRSGDPL